MTPSADYTSVANSPRTSSYPLPSPGAIFTSPHLPQTPATPTSSSSTGPPSSFPFPPPYSAALSQSPPQQQQSQLPAATVPQKKRSSLSMLLNDDHEPPRKTPRIGIAALLSPAPTAEVVSPLSGAPNAVGGASGGHGARPSSSSSTGSQPHPLRSSFTDPATSDTERRSVSSQSPTMSPARVFSLVTPQTVPPKPFTPPRLPYNPRRITPAGSVLRPLTKEERLSWVSQNPLRNIDRPGQKSEGPSPLGKRPREQDENYPPPAKRSKDTKIVAQHCTLIRSFTRTAS